MKCTLDQIDPAEYRKLYEDLTNGTASATKPSDDSEFFCRPAYGIDNTFKTTMDEWAKVTSSGADDLTWTIKSEEIKESDWSKVGHQEGSGGISFGWLRIGGGGGKDWSDSNVTKESGSFEIQLSAKRGGLFNITPGLW
jgi:hypothetical protein